MLTAKGFCAIVFIAKSVEEDKGEPSAAQRGTHVGVRVPQSCDLSTTSEPSGGNAGPGAPVKASMSGSIAATRVEPWNTFVSHP